jgi:hypothetical protein
MKCVRASAWTTLRPCRAHATRGSVWCFAHRRAVVEQFRHGVGVTEIAVRERVPTRHVEDAIRQEMERKR